MKILHVIHSFPPESHGGTETYVQELVRQQDVCGERVVILAGQNPSSGAATLAHENSEELDVWRIASRHRVAIAPDGVDLEVAELYRSFLAEMKFDLVHVHHWHNVTSNLVEISRRAGLGTVLSLHDHFSSCPFFFRLRAEREFCDSQVTPSACAACIAEHYSAPLDICQAGLGERQRRFRSEIEMAGACLALSQDQVDLLADMPLYRDIEVDVLPLPALTMPLPGRKTHANDNLFSIISWGGLVRGKGMHMLLEACQLLQERNRVSVHHYGRILDQEYADELCGMVEGFDFQLHGPYSRDQMMQDFADHDVAVFPSLFRETHGIVVDEAMLLGLPVLVSDRGAPRERVGNRGSMYAVDSARSLAGKLTEWMSSPEKLSEMRRQEPALGGAVASHAERMLEVYKRVLSRRTRATTTNVTNRAQGDPPTPRQSED